MLGSCPLTPAHATMVAREAMTSHTAVPLSESCLRTREPGHPQAWPGWCWLLPCPPTHAPHQTAVQHLSLGTTPSLLPGCHPPRHPFPHLGARGDLVHSACPPPTGPGQMGRDQAGLEGRQEPGHCADWRGTCSPCPRPPAVYLTSGPPHPFPKTGHSGTGHRFIGFWTWFLG